ncbi:glycosyltransferase family 4 protein [Labrenzia aggregata]|uniref:Glycosyltransferase family 4 protein n=2 Tax=Roseibium aggregatum TaxID=187304 RepID=A0A939EBK9_9HYPH|nr:glycosyltransferase family 4 protein [Roseibium aggregatum]
MKPLDHPIPSGDRTMGRLIVKALESEGHAVTIASTFRSWSREGGEDIQSALKREALAEAERIASDWSRSGDVPDLFLTYHLYHKAPDWIGPALADRFDIPYAVIEASRAPKRMTGDWSFGFAAADQALKRADAVAAMHNADAQCLKAVVPPKRLTVISPFLDTAPFQAASETPKPLAAAPLKLLSVGMMRDDSKTTSYEVLARALALLQDRAWRLTIIGDGPNRDHVLSLFPPERIDWLGALPPERMPAEYARHDLVVWPAIREAFGFVLLEAQAAGVGVIAGDTFGVPDIVRDGETGLLSPEGDVEAFAANLKKVIDTPSLADRLGHAARAHITERHSLETGSVRLSEFLSRALVNHADRLLPGDT